MPKKKKRSYKKPKANRSRLGKFQKFFLFVASFAIAGGAYYFLSADAAIVYVEHPYHSMQCLENTPSKTAVRPGETFTAKVRIRNNGTSVYHPDFGVYLEEFRSGPRVWNASGINLSGRVDSGKTVTFNLRMKAPNKTGTYSFNWGIAVAMKGFMRTPCTGKSIRVMNPPKVTLKANNQNKNISITKGNSLKLNWSSTNSPTSCRASGSWGGSKAASGSQNLSSDAKSAGTKTYSLKCSNPVGSSSATRTVTVKNPPPKPTAPSRPAAPAPARPNPPSNNNPTNSPASNQRANPVNQIIDNDPPPKVGSLSGRIVEDFPVELTWERPNYDGTIKSYEVHRSTDNKNWEVISKENHTEEVYVDLDVDFATTYYYRVRAIAQNNKKSPYSKTNVTTKTFEPNLSAEDENENEPLVLTSADSRISATIPQGAIDEDALCNIVAYNESSPEHDKNWHIVGGPYQIVCKNKDGDTIDKFKSPISVTYLVHEEKPQDIRFMALTNGWTELEGIVGETTGTYQLQEETAFAVLAPLKKPMSTVLKAAIALAALAATIFGGLYGLNYLARYRQMRDFQRKQNDYYRKEHGY